ncbi:RCC1 and BTB domain-containing protein 1 [Trachymyrmex cornetzi]|uniref:RCC1 and BTB domain-containing protein 1 n=1 Tax=Trachymyrmex cornetzi TaxID=471704 RepID=A0A151J307_9HYME|nr:RCC1 and BTB domain-containing protein 1 [Trachymyrmex cornetzi]
MIAAGIARRAPRRVHTSSTRHHAIKGSRELYRFRLCCNESYTLIITGKIDTKGSDDVELKISGIACGKSSSVFITRDGKIYECTDTNTDFYGPLIQSKLLPLSQKIIVKVVAGFDHILALTAKGKVYGWGANIHGQLNFNRNCGQAGRLESPSEINIPNVRKVSDIAAMKFMSAVKSSDDGLIYIQGCLQGKKIKRFAVCEYTNIFDGQNSSFYLRKENYTDEEKDIMDDLRNAFNDRSTSDLTIQVDGQSIYVHKSILKMRSSYFKNMFAFNEMQNRQRVIKYGDYSYDVYRNFFRFLYTGCVFYTCSKEMTELLKLSDQYCEINLEEKCIKKLKKNMNSSNVSYIKEIAIKYNKRVTKYHFLYCFRISCNESHILLSMRKIDIGVIQREDMEVKIIGLACGKSSVVFITNAGEIFECDSTVDLDYVESRKLLPLSHEIIVKVAAGFDHILALTDKGRVYGWGANTHGQLNFNRNYGQAERLESPSEIHIPNVRKVSDIAAMKFMSAVKSSDDGLVYIQGCLHGKKIRRFAVCEYTNIFDRYNSSFHSLKENHTCTQEEHEIEDSLICAFNNRVSLLRCSIRSSTIINFQLIEDMLEVIRTPFIEIILRMLAVFTSVLLFILFIHF